MSNSTTHTVEIHTFVRNTSSSQLLTEKDKERLQSIKSAKARAEFSYSHTLLNNLLISRLGITIDELDFSYNSHSKPYLSNRLFNSSLLYFSLSHSSNTVAIGISEGVDIGIDIEDMTKRKLEACQKLAERYYTPSEQEYLKSSSNSAQIFIKRFFQIWTLKEAYLKAIGSGINVSLSSLDFILNNNNVNLINTNEKESSPYRFYTTNFDRYALALAAKTSAKLCIKTANNS